MNECKDKKYQSSWLMLPFRALAVLLLLTLPILSIYSAIKAGSFGIPTFWEPIVAATTSFLLSSTFTAQSRIVYSVAIFYLGPIISIALIFEVLLYLFLAGLEIPLYLIDLAVMSCIQSFIAY